MRHLTTFFTLALLAAVAHADDAAWQKDWQAAREKARKEGKPLVLATLAPG